MDTTLSRQCHEVVGICGVDAAAAADDDDGGDDDDDDDNDSN